FQFQLTQRHAFFTGTDGAGINHNFDLRVILLPQPALTVEIGSKNFRQFAGLYSSRPMGGTSSCCSRVRSSAAPVKGQFHSPRCCKPATLVPRVFRVCSHWPLLSRMRSAARALASAFCGVSK